MHVKAYMRPGGRQFDTPDLDNDQGQLDRIEPVFQRDVIVCLYERKKKAISKVHEAMKER